jgi:hypothetical protein
MKKIKTSDITAGAGMRVKRGTLEHLQSAYQEAISALVNARIGDSYDPNKVYLLHGVKNSTTAPLFTISAGAVFFNGEIYLVDAVTFTAGGGETAVFNIVTTNYTAAIADPVLFSDGGNYNIHEIRKMVISSDVSGAGDADYLDMVEYIEEENFTDLSSGLSFHANLTGGGAKCLRYQDGTVLLRFSKGIAGNIAANTTILTGIPAGPSGGVNIPAVFLDTATGLVYTTKASLLIGNVLKTALTEGIVSATYSNIFVYLLYKTE